MWTFILSELKQIQFWEIIGLLTLFLSGFGLLNYILRGKHYWFSLGLSIPTGFGIATIFMTLLGYVGIPISPLILKIFMLAISILTIALQFSYLKTSFNSLRKFSLKKYWLEQGPISITSVVFLVMTLFILSVLYIKSVYWQPISWDVLTSFDLNAKAIAHEGKIIHSLYGLKNEVGVGVAYTPMISMSFAYLYLFGFDFPKIYPPIILISFAILFYHMVKISTNRLWASIFTLFCLLTPEFISHGAICQTNLSIALFAFGAASGLFLWYTNEYKRNYLYLAYIMAFLASWTRSEGFIVIGLVFLISILPYRRDIKKILPSFIAAIIAFTPFLSWQIFQKINADLFAPFTQATIKLSNLTFWSPDKIEVFRKYTAKHTLEFNIFGITFYLFWFFLIAVILYKIYQYVKTKKIEWDAATLSALMGLFLWFAYLFLLYQMTFLRNLDDQIRELDNVSSHSYKRFLFIVVPFAWYFIATNVLTKNMAKGLNKFMYGSRA